MEGLWTVEFGSSTGMFGGGVAVFRDGKIVGGDGTYYYLGEFNLRGNAFDAKLRISPFIPGAKSVFGTVGQELTLELVGTMVGPGQATAQGHPTGMPGLKFGAKLTKRA
jgi:T3SS negative regulator,GrlR